MGSVTMTRFLMLLLLCFFLLQVNSHPSNWKLVEMESDEADAEGDIGDTAHEDDKAEDAAPGNIAEEETSGKDEDNWDADWQKIPETARGHLGKEGPHMDVWDM